MLRNEERTQTDILLTKVSSDTELMAKASSPSVLVLVKLIHFQHYTFF